MIRISNLTADAGAGLLVTATFISMGFGDTEYGEALIHMTDRAIKVLPTATSRRLSCGTED